MRYSLIVNRITDNIDDNVKRILEYIDESKNNGAEFVLFPECALTGLQNNDIEEHDLKLGIKENSKHIRLICESCICYFKKGPKFAT
ncbi:MAG: hypothetical protein KAH01_01690, partial [Caldisericia bacterium]|nr:hypothetical protein [Caldisericia bacterium]